jgi:ABC-type branched-subunit amino acid transport system ATPase component
VNLKPEELADLFAFETKDISKHFGAVRAVDGLTLQIPIFGMTSIVGPNGSGKSTLINLLSGSLPLDGGLVIIEGENFRVLHAHESVVRGITRTFQEVRLFDQISVLDNILVVLTERSVFPALFERTTSEHRNRAEEILQSVGMWDKRDSLAMDLSYGQRKLLEIGRVIAMDAKIYLFDEPFAGLFPQMLERVKDIMKKMRDDGHTIVFVSHNMDIVREMSDHIIVLDSGKQLLAGEVEDILTRQEVIEAYLGA